MAPPVPSKPDVPKIVKEYMYARADKGLICKYDRVVLKKYVEEKVRAAGFDDYKVTDVKKRYDRWLQEARGTALEFQHFLHSNPTARSCTVIFCCGW